MAPREPAIAARAADWLESMELEVYEEVRIQDGGRIADLVGVAKRYGSRRTMRLVPADVEERDP